MGVVVVLLGLLVTVLRVDAAGLYDPRSVVHDHQKLWVRIAPGQITRVVFPAPLTAQTFALSPAAATLSTDPGDPSQLVIEAHAPEGAAHLTVNTTTQAYVVVLRRAVRADSVVTVAPPPVPAPEGHRPLDARAAMRAFWLSQWWGRSLSPGIRVEPVEGSLMAGPQQETRYVAYQRGLGFYGWTLRVTNTSGVSQRLDIEAMQDDSGRLLSIMPQRRDGAPELLRLAPGQSMLLHLTYLEGRR